VNGFDAGDMELHVFGQTFAERVDVLGIREAELLGGESLKDATIEGGVDF
jgi:hypothetical protein